jgi:hypothetical protein
LAGEDRHSRLPEATPAYHPRVFSAGDLETLTRDFRAGGELVFIERAVEGQRLHALVAEARRLAPAAVRMHVPFFRRGGTVAGRKLRHEAPALAAFHAELLPVVTALAGRPCFHKDADDDHALALYAYGPGDFMARHHDRCGSSQHGSYSITLGLVNEGRAAFEHGDDRAIVTTPGSLVIYNGTRVAHAVSRLAPGEQRIVLSASYRTTPHAERGRRLMQEVVEGWVYFGLRSRR